MAGFKTWVFNEEVPASAFQELVQDQVVCQFVDVATANIALSAVAEEGQLRAVRDVDRLQVNKGNGTFHDLASWGNHDTTWFPTVDATTTPPTLGTGNDLFGRTLVQGSEIKVQCRIAFGSSGAAAGSGIYQIDTPHDIKNELHSTRECIIGQGVCYDDSTAAWRTIYAVAVGADIIRFRVEGTDDYVTDAAPWTWANDDVLFDGQISYERTMP